MTLWHAGRLTPGQDAWVARHLADPVLVADMSWNLIDTAVLHVRDHSGSRDRVVKAGGADNHHIPRELIAHRTWTDVLTRSGHAQRLIDADDGHRVLLLEYLPGTLVQDSAARLDSDIHRQAGRLLRLFHDQATLIDETFDSRASAKSLQWLDRPHRIAPELEERARGILSADVTTDVGLVPTHGDWHERNWLLHDGVVRAIDFGRFDFRPAITDFTRLAAGTWRTHPALELAFFEGYGEDPRESEPWRREMLRQAIGTACWAYQVNDAAFEAHGHRMLRDALDAFSDRL